MRRELPLSVDLEVHFATCRPLVCTHWSLASILTHDHRRCDECLATLEGSVQGGRWAEAQGAGDLFARALRAHLQAEEQVLFPAFERATGQWGGGPP